MNTKKYRVCGDLKAHVVDIGVDGDAYEVKLSYLQNPTLPTVLDSETKSVPSDSSQCCDEGKKLVSSAA